MKVELSTNPNESLGIWNSHQGQLWVENCTTESDKEEAFGAPRCQQQYLGLRDRIHYN